MTKEEKIDFLISCAEDLENDHNLEIWGIENLQECADAFRDGAEALKECAPKKGKWSNKFKSDPSSIFGTTLIGVCSNCNKENSIGWTKYCPHCGAEMENGE